MHIQLQFKSFYKTQNNHHVYKNLNKNKNVTENFTRILLFFIFFSKQKNNKQINNDIVETIHSSIYQLPQKKKNVIFLRAPYKNKLARLNIVRLERTSIITFKINKPVLVSGLANLYKLGNLFFDTHKLKHTKTQINFLSLNTINYKLANFN